MQVILSLGFIWDMCEGNVSCVICLKGMCGKACSYCAKINCTDEVQCGLVVRYLEWTEV